MHNLSGNNSSQSFLNPQNMEPSTNFAAKSVSYHKKFVPHLGGSLLYDKVGLGHHLLSSGCHNPQLLAVLQDKHLSILNLKASG